MFQCLCNIYTGQFYPIGIRLYEISPPIPLPVYIYFDVFGNLNSDECKRRMLLCNGDSDAGNAKGHFGKDLHEDGRQCGLRIKLNLLPEKKKGRKIYGALSVVRVANWQLRINAN